MGASRHALASSAFIVVLSLAREASAAEPARAPGTQWYVETVGVTCGDQRAALEREIKLACGAVSGACGVAASPKEAELRAVLDCSAADESWTLVTRTRGGIVLNTIDLTGPRADRLREAAVEVARDRAPEHALAVETLRFSLAAEEPARAKDRPQTLTLVLGARGSAASTTAKSTSIGGRVLGGLAITRLMHATLGGIFEGGGTTPARGGAGIAFGAPFDGTSIIGFAAEAGIAATRERGTPGFFSGETYTSSIVVAGYGQGTVTMQMPLPTIRPYVAVSAAVLTEATLILASAEVGLAFAVF